MRALRLLAILVIAGSYLGYVFRMADGTPLRSGIGDWIDPYFINYLMEHWHYSLIHLHDPSSPLMYFPVKGTLGYSHGLILFAPFYLAIRPFADAFQAYNVTLFVVAVFGSVGIYLLFRRIGLGFIESILLSLAFFSSANVTNPPMGTWSQRASVFLIPPMILLTLTSIRVSDGRTRQLVAMVAGVLPGLLMVQDFYTAALAVLTGGLFLAGAVLLVPESSKHRIAEFLRPALAAARAPVRRDSSTRPPSRWWMIAAALGIAVAVGVLIHPIPRVMLGPIRFSATDPVRPLLFALLTGGWFANRQWHLATRVGRGWKQLDLRGGLSARSRSWVIAFGCGGIVGLLIFLWFYIGAYREHPAFQEQQLFESLTRVDREAWRSDRLSPIRVYDSLRPFSLLGFISVLAWIPPFRMPRNIRRYSLWVLVVSVVVLLLPLKFGGFSFWKAVFAPIPGLSIIRDPKRIVYLYDLAAVILAGLLLAHLPSRSPSRIAVSVVAALVIATTWNHARFDFERPRGSYYQWVEAPVSIDRSCRSFFIKGASPAYMARSPHMWTLYGVDSAFVALKYSLPTLNGYSAWAPDGWQLANPQEPEYPKRVADWIERKQLRDVCEFDIEQRTMKPWR